MKWLKLVRLRLSRGASLAALGPNEARLLFDGTAGFVTGVLAWGFCHVFIPGSVKDAHLAWAVWLTLLLLLSCALSGIYSRLRLAPARVKAAVLAAAALISAALALCLSAPPAVVTLWTLLVVAPLVLARLFVSLHSGRHRALARIAVNRRGPILVIGGAGYIGSHTVALLLEAGREVRVLDRLMCGDGAIAEFRGNPRFSLIEGDVTDIARLTAAMRDCSGVVHLAGLVGDPACAVRPEYTRHTNIVATRMAKEVAQSLGVHRFLFASSCSVYGISDREVAEGDALNPVSLYAQTKIDSEREILANTSDDFFVTVLRFATVFGHSRRPRFDLVANLFTAQAMTDGLITVIGPNQWRPFVHVRDLARAIVLALNADPRLVQNQIFNVGDSRLNMTILQMAECVQRVASRYREVNISVAENPGDLRSYAVSFEKIRSTLGFQAATLMEQGIEEMVQHFLDHSYGPYRSPEYSNVAMTARAVEAFDDPAQLARLYAPLNAG